MPVTVHRPSAPDASWSRVQGLVSTSDFDYVLRVLGGGVHGLQRDLVSELFTRFATYVRSLNLPTYADNRHTPDRLRRIVANLRLGVRPADTSGDSDPPFVARRADD